METYSIDKQLSNEKIDNKIKKESEIIILSSLEKSYYNNIPDENFNIPNKLLKNEKFNIESDNNISLFNALYNSLINKDNKSFLFCIQQNNETLIEETVKQMNNDCIGKFIEKSLDIFQSNTFFVKNIILWINKIIKLKKINILSKNNIENFNKIQIYIKDKIKCFNNLCLLKQKMNKINKLFCSIKENKDKFIKNNENSKENKEYNENKPIIFEPLLTYYESEDEEEKKNNENKKNKMEIEGFEEINENNINEEDENENEEIEDENDKEDSEEDYFDEEIDNMDNENKIKNKKLINKEKEEEMYNDDDDEEENEDNEEND